MAKYLFASQFGIGEHEVESFSDDYVQSMVFIHSLVREREKKDMERKK
jgi:hypothetical protein